MWKVKLSWNNLYEYNDCLKNSRFIAYPIFATYSSLLQVHCEVQINSIIQWS